MLLGRRGVALLFVVLQAGPSSAISPFVGAGACASRSCHGSSLADARRRIRGDEYTLWATRDPHRRAYRALVAPRGMAIARRLGITDGDPTSAAGRARCLGCHATAPEAIRATTDEADRLADGVSCEACHGPAGGWLRGHRAATRATSLKAGMVETMRPARAAETCVRCHVGTPGRRVDHEILAAGHPPLVFELAYFARNMPAHWKRNDGNAAWDGAEPLLAGGSVTRRSRAALAATPEPAGRWPDFSRFECAACHHPSGHLGRAPSVDTAGIVTGRPPADTALERMLAALGDESVPDRMLRRLVGSARTLGAAGYAPALHAYWAADDLVAVSGRPVPRALLDRLEADVRRPASYDPDRFTRDLSALVPPAD